MLHCALASCGAVYCNRSVSVGLCVCVCVCVFVGRFCYHDNSKLRASTFALLLLQAPHQTGFVDKSSDHLLAVPRPREGVCGGAKFFGSPLLKPARSFASLCAFLFPALHCGIQTSIQHAVLAMRKKHRLRCRGCRSAQYLQSNIILSDACIISERQAPCGLRGCKNGPAPFPGRMSYTRRLNQV